VTVSHRVEPQIVATLEGAIAVLRRRGLRLSSTRRLMLEALFAAEGPVSAERVASQLKLDAASVHRNLETLERHGLVRHVHLGHGPGLYALLAGGEREYLYCDRCGAARAVPAEQLDPLRTRIRERYGFQARFDHFPIVGLCPDCAASGAEHRRPSAEGAAH
jgi:Fur family ferric uptake transcriptional regulator